MQRLRSNSYIVGALRRRPLTETRSSAGTSAKPYESFVINLDRQPDRLVEFQRRNADSGLTIQRFAAIDGGALDEKDRRAVARTDEFTKGMLGSACSHKALWERAAAGGRPIIIFEDDAVLRLDVCTALTTVIRDIRGFWDILLLGFNTDAAVAARVANKFVNSATFPRYPSAEYLSGFRLSTEASAPARLISAFGICGYAITPRGAQRFLERCFPMDKRTLHLLGFPPVRVSGIDSMMNAFYGSLDAYVCFPPLVMTPNEQATSATR